MYFVKLPLSDSLKSLSPRELHIYVQLHILKFNFSKNDGNQIFWVTDRVLAKHCNCSTRSVWMAKMKLQKLDLIRFTTAFGNRTHYTLKE